MTRRKLTFDEAEAILRVKAQNAKQVAAAIVRHSDELEGLLNAVGNSDGFPHIVVAVFRLLEVAISLVWAAGLNKSRDIAVTALNCISSKGKDRLHEARLNVVTLDRWSEDHE